MCNFLLSLLWNETMRGHSTLPRHIQYILIINSLNKTKAKRPSANSHVRVKKMTVRSSKPKGRRRKKRYRWKNMIYSVKNVETHAGRENGESVAFPLDKFINPIGRLLYFCLYRVLFCTLLLIKIILDPHKLSNFSRVGISSFLFSNIAIHLM